MGVRVTLLPVAKSATEIIFCLIAETYKINFRISPIDEMFVLGQTWHRSGKYIACSSGPNKWQYLHVLIAERAGIDTSNEIDHKDRDKLNDMRDNLRAATHAQNRINTPNRADNISGFKGVNQLPSGNWQAGGRVGGKTVYLGSYETALQAAIVYDIWGTTDLWRICK